MKRILFTIALLVLPSIAFAQCNGTVPNNYACGNVSGGPDILQPIPLSSFPTNIPGGSSGQLQTNNGSGGFGGMPAMSGSCTINTSTGVITCANSGLILPPQGRLTLASHTPVMIASQTSQSTIYYDSYGSNQVPYFTGSIDILDTIASNEVSSALQPSGTGALGAGDVFDVWWEGNTYHNICVATNGGGSGWSGDTGASTTSRGTGYTQLDFITRSYTTNKNAIAHCYNGATDYGSVLANRLTYLATILTDAASAGQVSFTLGTIAANGGAARIGVWNAYNRSPFKTLVADNTGSWTYAPGVANTFREAHGSTTFSVTQVFGISSDPIIASYTGIASPGASTAAIPGIGFDSTTVFCDVTGYITGTTPQQSTARCRVTPGAGIHAINALESNSTTTSTTWFGWLAANYGNGLIYEGNY